MRTFIFCLLFLSTLLLPAQEQYEFPSLSPKGTITQVVGNTTFKVSYERPSVRGRKIFGGLVPWNKVWRTGAAYCTKISFDQDVIFGKQMVKAGKYSLFTIPNPDEWTVILNTDTTLYGSYDYDLYKDVCRFKVKPKHSSRFYEAVTIDIDVVPNNAHFYIAWANTQIDFPVETSTDALVDEFVKTEILTYKSKIADEYTSVVGHWMFQGRNYFAAIPLLEKAIELDPYSGWAHRLRIELFESLERYPEAWEAAKAVIKMTKERTDITDIDRRERLESWQKDYQRVVEKMNASKK
ncbi:MAG: DUF2911 domain-containing protein [Saprospiraceae bacterium]